MNAAMFTLLPPGSRLGAHRDPFAGSLYYLLKWLLIGAVLYATLA